ncbi:DUF1015 domain-containing protein [Alkalibacter rhizosphaerae]|uniref:DUF1015 domain-containing protein n=1 Tax=Alkalibacter rhizosphaerae TaxID=2815577 RepID=A0A975AH29_9FIRM|nr:DUF1015 family protein [Alkalibacter rhizosphaerae]QSX08179.1 DUF1015 domain-containing protein [Alkalibacter rhizosphaerae]
MATIRPFASIRPSAALAPKVAALPYDVYNRDEAAKAAEGNPYSFLHIDKPEIDLPDNMDPYDPAVYEKAKANLDRFLQDEILKKDEEPGYYIYALTMEGRRQTGLVCCSLVDDYEKGIIKRHELTREDKEMDRIRHVDACDANTGPIFLTYRAIPSIQEKIDQWIVDHDPENDFETEDGIRHQVWLLNDPQVTEFLTRSFQQVPYTYIADGHHRTASAVKVGLQRRSENPDHTGEEAYNYFLSVLFPDEQLKILDYNRVVKDLNGMKTSEFITALRNHFHVHKVGPVPHRPSKKGEMGMYLDGNWYSMSLVDAVDLKDDPVSRLDVSILQEFVLEGLLGIKDIRRDHRIDFIGGIRGLDELERRCQTDMKVAFAMFPTSIEELMDIADAGLLMPPKSTWFEPKLRSGLFIHSLVD